MTQYSDEVSWVCGGCGSHYKTTRSDVGHCMPCKVRSRGLNDEKPTPPEEQPHRAGCPAIADDESDYAYLLDAGICTCGAARGDADDAKETK